MSESAETTILDGDRKRGPDIKTLPHRSSMEVENLEVKSAWRSKDDLSPSFANMYQSMPSPYRAKEYIVLLSTCVKYFQQDIVRKHVNCYRVPTVICVT